MPRPTSTPKAYATTAGRRTEPDAGELGTGRLQGKRLPARIFNWLVGVPNEWVEWLATLSNVNGEPIHAVLARTMRISLGDGYPAQYGGSSHVWVLDTSSDRTTWIGQSDTARLMFPLNAYVRGTHEITSVGVIVDPGVARATSGNRILVELLYQPHTPLFPATALGIATVIDSARDDGTTNQQIIVLTGLTHDVDTLAADYYVRVTSGNDASSNNDKVLSVTLGVNDGGPRNAGG